MRGFALRQHLSHIRLQTCGFVESSARTQLDRNRDYCAALMDWTV